MLDYKALKGDATDNIPGVPGVGEKTAAKLVSTFGTLDALYERIDEVTPEKLRPLLLEAKERVLESRELQRLVRDVPVELDPEAARLGVYDREAVVSLFREYEFRTLIDRLPPLLGETAEQATTRARDAAGDVAAARAPGAGPRPRQAAPGSLQLSLDFDAVGPAPAPGPVAPLPGGRPAGRPRGAGRRSRPRGARRRGGAAADLAAPGWARSRPSAWRSSSTTRVRAPGRRSPSRWPARTDGWSLSRARRRSPPPGTPSRRPGPRSWATR